MMEIGIGYELATICAENGFDLIIAADEPKIKEAATALRTLGAEVEAVEADLATLQGVDKLYEKAKALGRPVDALLANAGRGLGRAFLDQDWNDIRNVIDTNITGTVYLVQKIARDMRERNEGKILITGSIAQLGSHYAITLEAADAHSGETLARAQVEAENKEQVLKSLDKAASSIRQKMGESLASVQQFAKPLEQATTSSLEALQAFSLGQAEHLKTKDEAAIPHLKRAVELDPNFAMAYATLGVACINTTRLTEGAEALKKAYDLRDRASERLRRGEPRWDTMETGVGLIDGVLWPAADHDADVFRAVHRWELQLDPAGQVTWSEGTVRGPRQLPMLFKRAA